MTCTVKIALALCLSLIMSAWSAPAYAAIASPLVTYLQAQWAIIRYQEQDAGQKKRDIDRLAAKAAQVSDSHPGTTEPLIWQAIILSTRADIEGGLPALRDAEHARDLLLKAESIDPSASQGIIFTSLGVLYDRVPGWPVGFGDKDRAKIYLEKGLALNPDGLDPNFFYGAFLFDTGDDANARRVLEHALKADPDSGNSLADRGRREEAKAVLVQVRERMSR